ncbi:esterase [Nocardiopsis lambiniae]|uniref:Esterase n=1 Tax=Nocardiopsis lambiniae TaxID=3075539 RepID=A0ABU2M6P9_9ACTN|nr:esterase [Nocardiopsis sp. DSM 44743]MDT0328269.1 esterase [Nocardiopsis sp. DSM 44743]
MFTTFSRRAFVLVSSGMVIMAAAALGTLPPEGLAERLGAHLGPDPALTTAAVRLPQDGSLPAPLPRPGQVSTCVQSGPTEVVTVPDETAPGGERELWVRRPPGPDSADLPVLYLLHDGDHRTAVDEEARSALDREMCRTGVEFVVAVPERVSGEPGVLTRAVVRAVEGGRERPRTLRAVGGTGGAAPAAVASPSVAQTVLWNPEGTEVATAEATRVLLVGGDVDGMAGVLSDLGMTVTTRSSDEDHATDPWGPSLPEAMDFLVSGWATTP